MQQLFVAIILAAVKEDYRRWDEMVENGLDFFTYETLDVEELEEARVWLEENALLELDYEFGTVTEIGRGGRHIQI